MLDVLLLADNYEMLNGIMDIHISVVSVLPFKLLSKSKMFKYVDFCFVRIDPTADL